MKRPPAGKRLKLVLGVTGSFGSGKSSVAAMFKERGALVIDADKIARGLTKPGSRVYKKVVSEFSKRILDGSARINRRLLADIVFSDNISLAKLNNIIHPAVIKTITELIRGARAGLVVLDAPLLVEAGLNDLIDKLIVVNITKKEQVKRLKARTSLSSAQINRVIRCQFPLSYKVSLADFVIDNSGSIEKTRKQVKEIWRSLAHGLGINSPVIVAMGSLRRQLWRS